MPQLHLYVPDDVADRIRARAKARRMSVSRFLAALVRREMGEDWPADYFDDVYGAWAGEPLERPAQGALEVRESL
jgi:hypothetical protein